MKSHIQPSIGWFVLSEADRASANRYLASLASDGTRDELGFAPIHFAFADRLFPGTSVQHAQLRYVFFVAWGYQELLARTAGQRFSVDELFEIERRFSLRLMRTVKSLDNSGISGWTRYQAGERPIVRASTIYWTALRSWKMVGAVGGGDGSPTEVQLRNIWPQLVTRSDGDEGKALVTTLFEGLPAAPAGWQNKTGELDFRLRRCEAEYLRRRWRVAGDGGAQPLLSRLTDAGVSTESLWSARVFDVATPSERRALVLARQAASLACIARAAHSALVEAKRNEDRGLCESRHADAFPDLRDQHKETALQLDVDALQRETGIDRELVGFIKVVTGWLRDQGSLEAIARDLTLRERSLKESRAFLLNEKRRRDWRKAVATPLDYRWPVVRNMIDCIQEAS
ncbi:DUF6361 family protein [Paraburkholderia phytofirmans]|uniref:Uncharacterized protein n=1 Tax=Paraburkholderia phytofirmans (strain DSM 17436 / LMG 22146 / PsJN) TaxID=398527 RepID=B2T8W3_PARPJ|nr:DUF6361 family protein [Paraburkholderia phytofirmans]ACD20776.1 conserved hypothetical protein [Paraburkholderia phytofirmans PsJN]